MLFSANDLIGITAKAEDFSGSVIDAFVSRDSMRISHLAVDIGGFLSNHTVVIATDKIAHIDPGSRSITLQTTKEQASNAPVLEAATLSDGAPLSRIPELVLGPSSSDVAAAFLQRNASQGEYFSATAARGSFASDGAEDLGRVIMLIANTDDLTISHLGIDTGVKLPETQRVVPLALVKNIGNAESPTVLAIDREKLTNSPQLEEFDAIDRHWLDKLKSYYGLS